MGQKHGKDRKHEVPPAEQQIPADPDAAAGVEPLDQQPEHHREVLLEPDLASPPACSQRLAALATLIQSERCRNPFEPGSEAGEDHDVALATAADLIAIAARGLDLLEVPHDHVAPEGLDGDEPRDEVEELLGELAELLDHEVLERIQSARAAGHPVVLVGGKAARPLAEAAQLRWLHELAPGSPVPPAVAWDVEIAAAGGPCLGSTRPVVVLGPGAADWLAGQGVEGS